VNTSIGAYPFVTVSRENAHDPIVFQSHVVSNPSDHAFHFFYGEVVQIYCVNHIVSASSTATTHEQWRQNKRRELELGKCRCAQ
jgi:hypothetical protein